MPYKNPADKAAWRQSYYEANRDTIMANNKAYVSANKGKIIAYQGEWRRAMREENRRLLCEAGCKRCGYNENAAALQWHHRDPITKSFDVSALNRSKEMIDAERAKCDVLCANCHAILHYDLESN